MTQPLVLLRSPQDHVVPPADSARALVSRISSTDVEEILLEQSYHVATLDHDAERIFDESYRFIGRLAPNVGMKGSTSGG
ncbi:alpha/beta fold hydrolase [Streptomyces californicus]